MRLLLNKMLYKQNLTRREFSKLDGHFLYIEKDYNEFKLQHNKQSAEEILIRRPVKTTRQRL